ncbi:ATP-binding protein [Kitasatospora sp. RG8]|uniref:ATP-binding protein n=1 Tax=Kitasatospora sp. RG8 TaxID=2820815 RepID=UPI001FD81628|nr:ATP-binding protein [Kitasatospora sp. RG8]
MVLDHVPGVVVKSREFTCAALLDWGWLPAAEGERRAVAEDVLLIVSELVTNAAMHAGGPIELRLRRSPAGLRVEVSDTSPELPVLRRTKDPTAPGGYGLRVVALLSWAWGSASDPSGKTVWSEIAAPPARPELAKGHRSH